ncbi:unnamed protein product [Diatraea saccharalis]|uniref:Uncharacterized protein n=1 Tax=Diatraea saccharalis TaxID=40085 RepID=A0A9N9QX07_9NEOP|nr:unnamed protein product [Diatraea saccharalis]
MSNFKLPEIENLLQSTDTAFGMSSDFYNPTNIKYKTNDPFQVLKKDNIKPTPDKDNTNLGSDYEIYFQNELKTPKKCGKEKVRIYLDKEKRKIRDLSKNYMEVEKFCNQF